MLVDDLLTQPAPVRVLVGVLAIGGGVLLWRLAPRLAFSGAEPSRCMRPDVGSPTWTDL